MIDIDQQYWDNSYKDFNFYEEKDALTKWLSLNYFNKKFPHYHSVFEIGCFPGRYLIHFGKKGMELNGMDQTPYLELLPQWLSENGISFQDFFQADILKFKSERKYDLVCSFGFIEHFINYPEVIRKHTELNAKGGTIIITTPNFGGGFQFLLHRLFDKKNLRRHNTAAMNPKIWANILEKAGYKIMYQGYFGRYAFWFDTELSPSREWWRDKYMQHVHRLLLRFVRFESRFFSPFCGVIATRT